MAARQHINSGNKHRSKPRSKADPDQGEKINVDESSFVIQTFRDFQQELDNRNDKHERIVKLSRDITIESKRLIFMLHRVNGLEEEDKSCKLLEAATKLEELHHLKFLPLAKELENQDPYQFLRAYTAGLQEYVEAVTFYHYLKSQHLVGVEEIQAGLTVCDRPDPNSSSEERIAQRTTENEGKLFQVQIPLTDYMLGIADFTGELMRMAINSVGSGDLETPKKVAYLMREIYNAFISFSNTPRELRRKTSVLRQSLQKVENACYNLRVRGSEIPKHMLIDVFSSLSSSAPDESYNANDPDDMI